METRGRNHYHRGMNSIVSEKGQVTIPKALRDRLGIRAGQVLDFQEEDGRLVAKKVNPVDPVAAVWGILRSRGSSDDIIRELRGEADGL